MSVATAHALLGSAREARWGKPLASHGMPSALRSLELRAQLHEGLDAPMAARWLQHGGARPAPQREALAGAAAVQHGPCRVARPLGGALLPQTAGKTTGQAHAATAARASRVSRCLRRLARAEEQKGIHARSVATRCIPACAPDGVLRTCPHGWPLRPLASLLAAASNLPRAHPALRGNAATGWRVAGCIWAAAACAPTCSVCGHPGQHTHASPQPCNP
mmetsp:Transcript_55230/g.177003  ORF Transcript_55230/g.177003 Transcript_55230/m.177003 type:complete len:219 (-) Transcript_55230:604-1260(-)